MAFGGMLAGTLLLARLGPAAADPADSGTAPGAEMTQQQREDLALTEFVAETDRFADDPGFGKVVVDYQTRDVTVLWKGEAPAALRQLDAGGVGATLHIHPALYDFQELNSAGLTLMRLEDMIGVQVRGTAPNQDFSGLAVIVDEPAETLWDAARKLRAITSIPITDLTVGGGVGQFTRQNDLAPWQGGGGMSSNQGSCTVGFAVLDGAQGRLLSAGHCDPGGEANMRDANGDTLSHGGDDIRVRHTNDTMLMDPVDGTIAEVYGGRWDAKRDAGRYEFKVVAKSLPAEGTPVCTSGANTGEHCNAEINNTGVNRDCGPGLDYNCHGFVVRTTADNIVGGAGDSGAPIYYDRGNGTVGARGILIGPPLDENNRPIFTRDCPNDTWIPIADGNCASRIFAVGYQTLEDQWGVVIEYE